MVINRGVGYTITEVMIVIAISGLMFISATVAFRGRQQQVQFDQAVRDFEGQLRDIMNDVATGYYPSSETVTCDVTGVESERPQITNTGTGLSIGTNEECLFVGKALQFKTSDLSEPNSSFRIFSLAGKRFISDTNPEIAESIENVKPTAVSFTDTVQSVRYGVGITKIVEVTGPSTTENHGVVVFMANFEGGNISDSLTQGQNVRIAGINSATSTYGLNKQGAIDLINRINEDSTSSEGYADFRSRNGVTFCLDDGAGRVASITVGSVRAESTQLKIGDVAEECK